GAGTAYLHAAPASDPAGHSLDHLRAPGLGRHGTADRRVHAPLLCRLAVGAHLSCRQTAADPVFAAYQLLRRRLCSGIRWYSPGDRLLSGQPDERRGRTGGAEHERDVWMERRGGAEMKIVVKLGGATLEDAALLQRAALAVKQLAGEHQVAVVHG